MRSLINFPVNQITIKMKKHVAYITYELLTKYQQNLGDYLKYSHNITPSGDIKIKIEQ
jgi:hypothetical protein